MEALSIGTLAQTAGVNVETIRFYQRRGLLAEPAKPYGGIRRYGEAHVTRVRFVKSAKRTFNVTVRPRAPLRATRSHAASATRASCSCRPARSRMSSPKVRSAPTDLRCRSARTGR